MRRLVLPHGVAPWVPSALTAYLWWKGANPSLPGLSCPLRALTGIPCPTCFLTRATAAALHGQLPAAFQLHAFGPVAAALLLFWSWWALRHGRLLPLRLPAWPLGGSALLLVVYWIGRMVAWRLFGLPAFPSG